MSKQQHTPGPWFSDSEGNIWRRDPKDLYQNGGGVAGEKPLATVHKGWNHPGAVGYPLEANARLIAAAPDLLEALAALASSAPSACCADFHHQPGDYHDAGEACPALDRYEAACLAARRAIAKARGES